MLPRPGEVLHFSEDPTITRFVPHVAATARQPDAFVWAVDTFNAPSYWFPRECPRVCVWPAGATDLTGRVHAVEPGWLEEMRAVELFAYRFAARDFEPFGQPRPHAHVSRTEVAALGPPEPVGDLVGVHAEHAIELTVTDDLFAFHGRSVAAGMEFSSIRLRNARARS